MLTFYKTFMLKKLQRLRVKLKNMCKKYTIKNNFQILSIIYRNYISFLKKVIYYIFNTIWKIFLNI